MSVILFGLSQTASVLLIGGGLTLTSLALGGLGIVCLVVAIVLFRQSNRDLAPGASTPAQPLPNAPSGPAAATTAAEDETQPPAPRPSQTQPKYDAETEDVDSSASIPSEQDARQAEANGEFVRAAEMWRRRGNLLAEREALAKAGDPLRQADLERALGRDKQASVLYREALGKDPANERVRLRLVQTLLDIDEKAKARELVDVVSPADSPMTASALFLTDAARSFEAWGDIRTAQAIYRSAASRGVEIDDLSTRLMYLNQLTRLAEIPAGSQQRPDPMAGFDDERPEAAGATLETRRLGPTTPAPSAPRNSLEPHGIIVGHMALGGDVRESGYSVRSIASTAARFRYMRLVGERDRTAVFEGIDRLLDCPVAVRISRINCTGRDFEVLCERLKAIAQLNHPNLTKMTFADHYGPIVRIATEYNGGGTILTLLKRLDRIGLPLMLRILNQVTAALANAHGHGILHGDLRPQNIMIGHDQLIKIVDFALQPWPVRAMPAGETSRLDTPLNLQEHEIQTDIKQFADLLDFLLPNVVVAPSLKEAKPEYDPIEELREVVSRAREGRFSSIIQVQRILFQILDACMPGQN